MSNIAQPRELYRMRPVRRVSKIEQRRQAECDRLMANVVGRPRAVPAAPDRPAPNWGRLRLDLKCGLGRKAPADRLADVWQRQECPRINFRVGAARFSTFATKSANSRNRGRKPL
jgi:hypothetical protein